MNAMSKKDVRCQYCDASRFTLLFDNVSDRLEHVEGKWRFYQCDECGSAQLDPLPPRETMALTYPDVYSPSPANGSGQGLVGLLKKLEHRVFFARVYRTQVGAVMKYTDSSRAGRSLLDVGCGRGLRLVEFARRGYQVLGTDFQEDAVAYVNSLGIPALVADAGELATAVDDRRFDVVTAFYCLEHAYDVADMLQSCHQVLKPGGWLVVACPLVDSLQAWVFGRRWSQVSEAPRHITLPSRKGVRIALARLGFTRIQMVADSVMWCAGMAAQSLLPRSATTFAYASPRLTTWIVRGAAAAAAMGWVPLSVVENYLIRRPGCGIFCCQKPAAQI